MRAPRRLPYLDAAFSHIPGTKLLIPRPRDPLLHRKRLVARLEAGQGQALTLLSAPAGYGKTTLVVDWLRSRASAPQAVAWLSLDAGDNDPVGFTGLLVAALRTAAGETGATALASIRSAELPPLRKVCTVLINDLLAGAREITLVLDDYHVIRQPSIHEAVVLLLRYRPPRLRVVVLSREDPPFPLVQLRSARALCELRATDLRFTVDETAAFLREVMDLPATVADAATLEARTEGWVAALQLAALSMPPAAAPNAIAAVGGNTRSILDYLYLFTSLRTVSVRAGEDSAGQTLPFRLS
jgi:LuxR family transcriptional regulator, maltose regulon positive regulatory protein